MLLEVLKISSCFIFDFTLSFQSHVKPVTKSAFCYPKNISDKSLLGIFFRFESFWLFNSKKHKAKESNELFDYSIIKRKID